MKAMLTVGRLLARGGNANQNSISLMDVKALYDAAYAEKAKARANLRAFKSRLAKAERLDLAYRIQLANACLRLHGKAV